jgi:hypothetical protein
MSDLEKKRKSEALEAANKREVFYRSQSVVLKKEEKESDLKLKINTRHDRLKKKYLVKK